MINIEEDQISKRIGRTRRNAIWSRETKGINHHSSKIVLKDSYLTMNPR
jgi:hypothetical protein